MNAPYHRPEKGREQGRVSPLAANFARWAAQPVTLPNRRAVIWTALTMLLMLFVSQNDPDQASLIRSVSMVLLSSHALLHMAILSVLRRFRDQGMVEAAAALGAYLSPYRITSLDLAISWAAFAAAVSLYRAVFPIAAIGQG